MQLNKSEPDYLTELIFVSKKDMNATK